MNKISNVIHSIDETDIDLYKTEFEQIIKDLCESDTVQKMKNYMQHCDTTCFDHCKQVAYYSYLICKKHGLDYISAARGGMLHDLFLYNWKNRQRKVKLKEMHAFTHPRIALNNSMKLFDLNDKEKDIILKHMWPVTVAFPKYKESYIITMVDKYCAIKETFDYMRKNTHKLYKYSTVFLGLFIFRII